MSKIEDIEQQLKDYILQEFLPDEDPEDLTSDIELISTGILNSVSVIAVVAHVEEEFGVKLQAHEANAETMNTIESMAKLVSEKV